MFARQRLISDCRWILPNRLFGRRVRGRRGNVRGQRVPAAAALVVRGGRRRRVRRGRRCRRRRRRRRLRRRTRRGRGRRRSRVPADGHGVPGVPGVRGPVGVRRPRGRPAPGTAVRGRPGAPAERGRRERAADGPRHDDPRPGNVPVCPGRRAGRGRRRAGRLRVRVRAAAQRRPRAARLDRRHGGLHGRRPARRRKGDDRRQRRRTPLRVLAVFSFIHR